MVLYLLSEDPHQACKNKYSSQRGLEGCGHCKDWLQKLIIRLLHVIILQAPISKYLFPIALFIHIKRKNLRKKKYQPCKNRTEKLNQ